MKRWRKEKSGKGRTSACHRRSAHDKVKNQVGIPSCCTIAITSYINFCQYGGLPGIPLRKRYAWSLKIRFFTYCSFDLNCDAVIGCPCSFFKAMFMLSETFFCSMINCAKKDIQDSWQISRYNEVDEH